MHKRACIHKPHVNTYIAAQYLHTDTQSYVSALCRQWHTPMPLAPPRLHLSVAIGLTLVTVRCTCMCIHVCKNACACVHMYVHKKCQRILHIYMCMGPTVYICIFTCLLQQRVYSCTDTYICECVCVTSVCICISSPLCCNLSDDCNCLHARI